MTILDQTRMSHVSGVSTGTLRGCYEKIAPMEFRFTERGGPLLIVELQLVLQALL